jgi:hypothetical protein
VSLALEEIRLELVPDNTLRGGVRTLWCSGVVEFGGLPHCQAAPTAKRATARLAQPNTHRSCLFRFFY